MNMRTFALLLLFLSCRVLLLPAQVSDETLRQQAASCKAARNYDQACNLYHQLLQRCPDDVSALADCAEVQLLRGNESDAVMLYSKVLTLDANHLQACIFMGNYYYLCGEKAKRETDEEYRKIEVPTRMQYARYRDALTAIFASDYSQARLYLQRVLQQFPSTEAKKTLARIAEVEQDIK